jgi:MFS family permease
VDYFVENSQVFIFFASAMILLVMTFLSNFIGRLKVLLLSGILHIWGMVIICFALSIYAAFLGTSMIITGFFLWGLYLIIYIKETFDKKSMTYTISIILLLGSFGLFFDLLFLTIFDDYRALCIICMVFNGLSLFGYYKYTETPSFEYSNSNLGKLYLSLKHILRINYGLRKMEGRLNALKGLIFNTNDSSFWVSGLVEGRLPQAIRLENLPKPNLHFLDDSRIDISNPSNFSHSYPSNFSNANSNPKSLSLKDPVQVSKGLEKIEKIIFNEESNLIQNQTMKMIYGISNKSTLNLFKSPKKLKLLLGSLSLLIFHFIGIKMSYSFVQKVNIFPQFWSNLFFALSIFIGIFISCLLIPQTPSRDIILLSLISICIICINFSTLEYTQSTLKSDKHLVSIQNLLSFHALIMISLLCSSMGFLIMYIVNIFCTQSRAIVLVFSSFVSLIFVSVFAWIGVGDVFLKGGQLNVLFFISIFNVMIAFFMPKDSEVEKNDF